MGTGGMPSQWKPTDMAKSDRKSSSGSVTSGAFGMGAFRSAVRTVQPQDKMGIPVTGSASTGFRVPRC